MPNIELDNEDLVFRQSDRQKYVAELEKGRTEAQQEAEKAGSSSSQQQDLQGKNYKWRFIIPKKYPPLKLIPITDEVPEGWNILDIGIHEHLHKLKAAQKAKERVMIEDAKDNNAETREPLREPLRAPAIDERIHQSEPSWEEEVAVANRRHCGSSPAKSDTSVQTVHENTQQRTRLTNDPMRRILNNEDIPDPNEMDQRLRDQGRGQRSDRREMQKPQYGPEWGDNRRQIPYYEVKDQFIYRSKIKITPVHLTMNSEFCLWYEQFRNFVHRYKFAKAFELENPITLSEKDEKLRVLAKLVLCEWLDEEHHKIIFNESDPTKCMIRIRQFREPQDVHMDSLMSKVLNFRYHPRQMNLAAWLNDYETMSRQLMCFTAEWSEQKKIDTFIKHMRIVFPEMRITTGR